MVLIVLTIGVVAVECEKEQHDSGLQAARLWMLHVQCVFTAAEHS
jgi:hypothetical protein